MNEWPSTAIITTSDGITYSGDEYSQLQNSAESLKNSIQPGSKEWLEYMAKDEPEYAEKLFDYMVNQQNVADARQYDEYVRKHNYQWMVEDLKEAGLNPYLALNSLGGSSGANIQASSNFYGASSAKATNENTKNKIMAILLASLIGSSAGVIAKALIS